MFNCRAKLCHYVLLLACLSAASSPVPIYTELPSTVLLKFKNLSEYPHPKKKWKDSQVKKYYITSRGSDGEFIDASNHFFWNKTDGLAMELGAVDGKFERMQSATLPVRLLCSMTNSLVTSR